MKLTSEEINKVAALARLNLTAEEADRHAETISTVLEYMTVLNEVDTTQVQPTFQVTGLENVLRADAVEKSDSVKKLIEQFPETQNDSLVVPAVFE